MKRRAIKRDASIESLEALFKKDITEDVVFLSGQASMDFVQAILNPPEPNAALVAAAERYKKDIKNPC